MKQFKSILSILLSVILITLSFPFTASAATSHTYDGNVRVIIVDDNNPNNNYIYSGSLPKTITLTKPQLQCTEYYISTNNKIKVNKDDKITFYFSLGGRSSRYKDIWSVLDVYYYSDLNSSTNDYFYRDGATGIYEGYDSSTSTDTVCVNSLYDGYIRIAYEFMPETFDNGVTNNTNFYMEISPIKYTVEADSTSFFNRVTDFFSDLFSRFTAWFDSLFSWLRDIRDKIISLGSDVSNYLSNLGDRISTFFNNLGDRISTFLSTLGDRISSFFTNLTNNLRTWFSNVGDWFSSLGDRISGFFTNLWNNITTKVDSVTQSISDWWQSVVDWFHSLFVPEEGYFDSYKSNWEDWFDVHFGLFVDIKDLTSDFIGYCFYIIHSYDESPLIHIPAVKLPFFNNPVIVPEINFNFTSLINSSNHYIYYAYKLYKIVVSCILYFCIIKFGYSTFNKLIGVDDI